MPIFLSSSCHYVTILTLRRICWRVRRLPFASEGIDYCQWHELSQHARQWQIENFTAPSERFDAWLSETMQQPRDARFAALNNWEQALMPHIVHLAGEAEHLLPLMVAVGAAGEDTAHKIYSEQVLKTQISAWQFR